MSVRANILRKQTCSAREEVTRIFRVLIATQVRCSGLVRSTLFQKAQYLKYRELSTQPRACRRSLFILCTSLEKHDSWNDVHVSNVLLKCFINCSKLIRHSVNLSIPICMVPFPLVSLPYSTADKRIQVPPDTSFSKLKSRRTLGQFQQI